MKSKQDTVSPAKVPEPISVKLVLLGNSNVGKSSIVLRYTKNEFKSDSAPTIGAAFLTQTISIGDQTVKFEIW